MGLKRRHDYVSRAAVPELGKVEISYPSPNIADRMVIERVPIETGIYEPLPYHSPHETYDVTGLILVWQGKVKAENNQVVAMRVYSNNLANEDWYNASMKFSGDAREWPIWVRSYIELREDFVPSIRATPLTTLMRLQVTKSGVGYTSEPTVTISGDGLGATARAIMNPAKTEVIALELLEAGAGYTAATVAFSGGGTPSIVAEALAFIQPVDAVLVKEEADRLPSNDEQASLFVRVHRIYETLPGPWLPFTRYDDDLGPIQGRRRAVLNTGQLGGIVTPTGKVNYEARDGSAIVSMEIEEVWSDGTGIPGPPDPGGGPPNPNTPYPIYTWDIYVDERGAVERKSQIVVATGSEVATLNKSPNDDTGIWVKVWYEPFKQNPYLLEMFTETWGTVLVDDLRVTSEHGGGVYKHTERTDEPGILHVKTGYLVMDSKLVRKSPDEQVLITDELDPNENPPAIELIEGGEGYTDPTTVIFTGGTCGPPPTAEAILGYGVTSVSMNSGGSGFHTPPTVNFLNGGGGGAFAYSVLGFGVDSVLVFAGGSNYSTPPDVSFGGTGTGATGNAILGFGVASATITNAGSGYTSAPNARFTGGGGGVGAAAGVLMGNPIGSIHVVIRGGSYETPPTLTVDPGADGSGFVGQSILGFGVDTIGVDTPGTNYDVPPNVVIDPPEFLADGAVQATAEAVLSRGVSGVDIDNGGSGFATAPTPSFAAGAGSGAAGNAFVGFAVASAAVDIAGNGYTSMPTASVGPGGGTGGSGAAVALKMGVVGATIVNGGTGYAVNDILNIVGGTGTVVAQLRVTAVGTAGTITETLVYSSDGDDQGVFYRIGTNYGASAWTNPITAGRVVGFFPNHGGGAEADAYVDRSTAANPYTTNTASTYAMFDLGVGQKLKVVKFSIRGIPGQASRAIRTFKLQGSNAVATNDAAGAAGATWTDIDIRSGDTTMSSTIEGAWASYVSNQGVATKFRWLRVIQTGTNAAGDNYFNQTEFEFYGDFDHAGPAGAISAVSVETAGVYSALAANPRGVIGGGTPSVDTLTWASNGDTNGLLYKIGTQFGASAWSNPHTAGRCTVSRSSSANGVDADLCDRAINYNTTGNAAGEWMAVDIGLDRTMVINNYILQNGSGGPPAGSGTHTPRNWKLQGSNNVGANTVAGINAATWTDIDTRTNDTSIPTSTGGWAKFTPGATPAGYRWFRILATGINNGGDSTNFLQIGEFEFYGALTRIPTGIEATFDLTYKVVEVNVTTPGTGYESAPPITIAAGGGTTATAHTVLAPTGSVKRVAMTTAGSGYTAPFAVSFSGGGGTGAAGTAQLGVGFVLGINVTNPGSGYVATPGVSLVPVGTGSGATASADLLTSGELWGVQVINGGLYVGTPTISVSGGGGAGASLQVIMDTDTLGVAKIVILEPGRGYTEAPLMEFDGGGGTGLAATAVLSSTGSVIAVEITAPGTGYTGITPIIFTASDAGVGAEGKVYLQSTGHVASVVVVTPGLFATVPDVEFRGGGPGAGGAGATAHLASTGSVLRVNLLTPGVCTVAPVITFGGGGTGAEAVYYPGGSQWPVLQGFHTDPVEGIVVDVLRKVVPHGTPHPGRLNFIDMQTIDRWKSIQIVSKVDLRTLPGSEEFPVLDHRFSLPAKLTAVEATWSDVRAHGVSAQAESSSAHISTGSSGGVILHRAGGYNGYPNAIGRREWFYGEVPASAIKERFNMRSSSGSLVIKSRHFSIQMTGKDDGGLEIGDNDQTQVHEIDASNLLVGTFGIQGDSHQSPPQEADATSGGGTFVRVASPGVISTMTVSIPVTSITNEGTPLNPDYLTGRRILDYAVPQKWRFGVWVLETVYVIIP